MFVAGVNGMEYKLEGWNTNSSLTLFQMLDAPPTALLLWTMDEFGIVEGPIATVHYIIGLSYDTNEPVLKDLFGQYGEIIEVKVVCNHQSGKSKGYGFVHFSSEESASKALAEMDGQLLDGRNIRIEYANKK